MSVASLIFVLVTIGPLSHAAEQYICGNRGYLTHFPPNPTDKYHKQYLDLETCKAWCYDQNPVQPGVELSCKAIGYDDTRGICYFLDFFLETMGFTADHKSDTMYYSAECYQSNRTCNLPNGVNILNNADFLTSNSTEFLGPWGLNGFAKQVSLPQYRVGSPQRAFHWKALSALGQTRGLCPGKDYKFSADYLIENTHSVQIFYMYAGDCELLHPYYYRPNSSVVGRYLHRECSVSGNSFGTYSYSTGYEDFPRPPETAGYWANPQLHQMPPIMSTKTVGPSLITNGDFENGDYRPWTPSAEQSSSSIYRIVSRKKSSAKGKGKSQNEFRARVVGGNDASFSISQNTSTPLKSDKSYLLIIRYEAIGASLFNVTIGYTKWSSNPLTYNGEFAKILSGLDQVETLTISTNLNRVEESSVSKLTFFLDTVSIREVAPDS